MSFDLSQSSFQSLRSIFAERTSNIVFWIGAGLSVPAGVPGWVTLRVRLCEVLRAKAGGLEENERARLVAQADLAATTQDLWVAFEILKKALGQATFRDTVRESLSISESAPVPENYHALWKLKPKGVLNLNLDKLATRAFTDEMPGKTLHEFSGNQTGAHAHVLKSPHPFMVNLHGTSADYGSWIFTRSDLKDLLLNSGYNTFIRSCVSSNTVVFVGITADDVAVGGHLSVLGSEGIDTGTHYWISPRADAATDAWAEQVGVRIIRYQNEDGRHVELTELLRALRAFVPTDDLAPPVRPVARKNSETLPEPDQLEREAADTIRNILNARAAEILEPNTPEAYEEYRDFCERYDQAIYRAFYVSTAEGRNKLFEYTLAGEIGRGAFGRVFQAHNLTGDRYAVKVLREDVRRNDYMLQSFRRGVRSNQILTKHRIPGTVGFKEASEIPASVVMDFVPGPSLATAVESRLITAWSEVLRISSDLSQVIASAHALPERVLHRDIRPANIMLSDYYDDHSAAKVVVLDFDLSWHRGALELSLVSPDAVSGYLAPELIIKTRGASTRSSAVDSFGVGMTLFFLRTGVEPKFSDHRVQGWKDRILKLVRQHSCATWHSLPQRFARLIYITTLDEQSARWDMGQIAGELARLRDAERKPAYVQSAELWAEELCARAAGDDDYEWDDDKLTATLALPSGVDVSLSGQESGNKVTVNISWTRRGIEAHRQVTKWVPKAATKAISHLKKGSWDVDERIKSSQEVVIQAETWVRNARANAAQLSKGVRQAAEALRFE